ncbi:large-conductance mechanosensitive channel protein MscL [Flavonifractor sp. HCP28S3_F3]|uniref:large-conductance mechanosensitive channel protein MscL n=1 Tax=Flavonifractor sp. HCP28S3_F3 TaxID=3438939 RepID=UPI003F8AFDAB
MSAKEKTKGFMAEFRKFIARGNVIDLAVGVIIGGAFQSIVNSLVNDVINPILGVFAGDSESLATSLTFQLPGGGQLMLGSFINAVINFLIMAFVIFLLVKGINSFHRKKEEAPKAAQPPKPSAEEVLLTEIRDLLKEGRHE